MGCQKKREEIVVCNRLFKYTLEPIAENTYELSVVACCTPTATYDIARITVRENRCNGMEYFQAFINTDPVAIIQDCNLENIIRRSIIAYFDNTPCIDCGGENGCCNCNRGFGLF